MIHATAIGIDDEPFLRASTTEPSLKVIGASHLHTRRRPTRRLQRTRHTPRRLNSKLARSGARSATPSVFHQRHIGRVLRSS